MRSPSSRALILLCLAPLVACGDDAPVPKQRDAGPPDAAAPMTLDAGGAIVCADRSAGIECVGDVEWSCLEGGGFGGARSCADLGQVCVAGRGCRLCQPESVSCDGSLVERCDADGYAFSVVDTCDSALGEVCDVSTAECIAPCEAAARERGAAGCEFWPSVTLTSRVGVDFSFGLALLNPGAVAAEVRVARGETILDMVTVPPGQSLAISLPWVPGLADSTEASVLARAAAYHVTSSRPIVVYQLSPNQIRLDRRCTGAPPRDTECYTYTSESSLVLPSHALDNRYIVSTYPTIGRDEDFGERVHQRGFATIVGTANAEAQVQITLAGDTLASVAGGGVEAHRKGEVVTFSLGRGDALQLVGADLPTDCPVEHSESYGGGHTFYFCAPTGEEDLTGTLIESSVPVAVYVGHDCANVPYYVEGCSHVEESLPPLRGWGRTVALAPAQRVTEPVLVRIVSSADRNLVRFQPEIEPARVLHEGDVLEVLVSDAVIIEATHPILVSQFVIGPYFYGFNPFQPNGIGSRPSMGFVPPVEQWSGRGEVIAPGGYVRDRLLVFARGGTQVTIDGIPVSPWRPVGTSGFVVSTRTVAAGVHRVEAAGDVGVLIEAIGPSASALYAGAQRFRDLQESP